MIVRLCFALLVAARAVPLDAGVGAGPPGEYDDDSSSLSSGGSRNALPRRRDSYAGSLVTVAPSVARKIAWTPFVAPTVAPSAADDDDAAAATYAPSYAPSAAATTTTTTTMMPRRAGRAVRRRAAVPADADADAHGREWRRRRRPRR